MNDIENGPERRDFSDGFFQTVADAPVSRDQVRRGARLPQLGAQGIRDVFRDGRLILDDEQVTGRGVKTHWSEGWGSPQRGMGGNLGGRRFGL